MRNIEVKRTYLQDATIGDGVIVDEVHGWIFKFKTLELPNRNNARNISCIPEDTYDVWKMKPTMKRPYEYLWVKDVPGRSGILWHPGNFTYQIRGCTLPGDQHMFINDDKVIDIMNTTVTLNVITLLMPEKFRLKIYS